VEVTRSYRARLRSSEGAGDCRAEVDLELWLEAGLGDTAGEAELGSAAAAAG
jgi:hypothetical protein